MVNGTGGIGGRPLQFDLQDDQSNPQVAVQLMAAAIAKHPPLVMGSTLTATCNAMAPLAANGPVLYCYSPGPHPKPGSFFFASGPTHQDFVGAAIRSLHLRGLDRIGLLTVSDATGQDGERAAVEAIAHTPGMVLVDKERFDAKDVGVGAQVTNLKAAHPQAIVSWTTGTPMGLVLRGMLEGGLDVPLVVSAGNLSYAFMHQYEKLLPTDLEIPTGPGLVEDPRLKLDPRTAEAARQFAAAFHGMGLPADTTGGAGWDGCLVGITTLQKLGPDATATQLRDAILAIKDWAGIWGIYDFGKVPNRGIDGSQVMMVKWDKAKQSFVPMTQPGGEPL
jgi:branched-chain amino acid transport system substrate-binding protein